jgi:hypothetical protein
LAIVSYHISKDEPVEALVKLVAVKEGDPFSGEAQPELPEIERLWKAPFESRFISEGDVLWEATRYFDWIAKIGRSGFHAVLNETTGRLVVRGSEEQLNLVKGSVFSGDRPMKAVLEFDLYQIPSANTLKEIWNFDRLPNEAEKISSLSFEGIPDRMFDTDPPKKRNVVLWRMLSLSFGRCHRQLLEFWSQS